MEVKEKVDEETGKVKRSENLIFPRYHQLDVIRKILADVYQMHGNQITVRTLDLNLPFSDIAKQLNTIAETHFDLPERSKG